GGRMTSTAQAEAAEPGVEALIFLGFPLHPAKQPAITRAAHLADVAVPMLFVQGTRDALAEPALLRPVVAGLGARATLHEIDGADHGFAVPKRTGRTGADVIAEIADTVATWLAGR
ncbi:MAG: alpha/beta hydrolase, partial [Myxococcales bacterium]|nr:alpha/beta hydrolase [Myxococcales bacterium]